MALADLKASLNISPPNREVAKTDEDFTSLKDDQEFKAIVGTA
jgi:hypothetical protein